MEEKGEGASTNFSTAKLPSNYMYNISGQQCSAKRGAMLTYGLNRLFKR